MKILIYVLCHNQETKACAIKEYGDKEWAKIICIETTVLLENIMYDKWLLEHYEDWKDVDYVGTISWKASKKILLPDMHKLAHFLEHVPFDIIPFYMTNDKLIEQATHYHPKFKNLWLKWLTALDIDQKIILDDETPAFFSNYWITKPNLMLKYIDYFKTAKIVLETTQDIQDELWENANYNDTLSKDKCFQIFGKPYFPYHVFLYERLPCFFFWNINASLLKPQTFPWLYHNYV